MKAKKQKKLKFINIDLFPYGHEIFISFEMGGEMVVETNLWDRSKLLKSLPADGPRWITIKATDKGGRRLFIEFDDKTAEKIAKSILMRLGDGR